MSTDGEEVKYQVILNLSRSKEALSGALFWSSQAEKLTQWLHRGGYRKGVVPQMWNVQQVRD